MIKKLRGMDYIQALNVKLDDLRHRINNLLQLKNSDNTVIFEVNPDASIRVLKQEINTLSEIFSNLGKEFPIVIVSTQMLDVAIYIAVTKELAAELYSMECKSNPSLPTTNIEFREINPGILLKK